MKTILLVVGIIALVVGLLWAGQGYGLIQWPPHRPGQFTMVGDMGWTYKGVALAVAGLIAILWSRR
ncbi:MAG: hypothetical protein ACTHLR_08450 [Rhizomicrobium sp.]